MRRNLDALDRQLFDVLILGGGITGAGVALDATLRGLRVGLIDKGDFASGTSSLSSKLIHGGLRYLEQGEFRLVHEALTERRRLLRNAPHLVWPLKFVLPFYRGARVPGWKFRVGLALYDLLAGRGNLHRSRALTNIALLRECPFLSERDLQGGAEYYDAQMDDARLCIEVLRTAAIHGATVANYAEAVAFPRTGGSLREVRGVDHLTGRELTVYTKVLLNVTGPWVDQVRNQAEGPAEPLLSPTKGVHLILPDRGLSSALLLLHPRDGRVFFVLPWMGKTLIGTTDTDLVESIDELVVTEGDIAYLLEGYNAFVATPANASDVLGSFVGVRPLMRSRPEDPSARSREYRILRESSGMISVVGGKYTTFRSMAEKITDTVLENLNLRRACRTCDFPLDGTPQGDWVTYRNEAIDNLSRRYGLSTRTTGHLVQRYGRRAGDVLRYVESNPDLAQAIHPDEPDIHAEMAYQRDWEMACRPADHWLRRTRLGLFHPTVLQEQPG